MSVKLSAEVSQIVTNAAIQNVDEMRLGRVELAMAGTCPDHGCKVYGRMGRKGWDVEYTVEHSGVYGCRKTREIADLTFPLLECAE